MATPSASHNTTRNPDSEELAKAFFIHATPIIPLGETNSVPTALYYDKNDTYLVGHEAINYAADREDIPNLIHDFKIALGNQGKSGLGELFPCSDGKERAASTLTGQFLRKLLAVASEKIAEHEISESAHVIIAEPIRVHGEENSTWLANYRNQIRSILADKEWKDIHNIKFTEVEFLPEPFAVFNYYRHGLRHAQIIGNETYRVLVVDIGGGTTDCSVIETTVGGEVKKAGKNSKPLGACSDTIGGYIVNHEITSRIFLRLTDDPNTQRDVKRSLKRCLRVTRGLESHSRLPAADLPFYVNYQWLMHFVEKAKCNLTKRIAKHPKGWIDAPPSHEEWIDVPDEPYSETWSDRKEVLGSSLFKEIFEDEVWKQHLLPLISKTIETAQSSLNGQSINRVILSGGTANIGWIKEWLKKHSQLRQAVVVDTKHDYQEIVAQGLAIECGRRFFSEAHMSDFKSVTYNPLSLMLGFDNENVELHPMRPLSGMNIPDLSNTPGALIGSATDMSKFIGAELIWKVADHRQKSKSIDYVFYNTSPECLATEDQRNESQLNFEEREVNADKSSGLGSPRVKILISDDGTVTPTFIFREASNSGSENSKRARRFAIDMTDSQSIELTNCKAYLGIDFGSTNTAMAFTSAKNIERFNVKSQDPEWIGITELPTFLPNPLARILSTFIAVSDDPTNRAKKALSMIETSLSLLLILLRQSKGISENQKGQISEHSPMKVFSTTQVSAGPIWNSVKSYIETKKGTRPSQKFTEKICALKEMKDEMAIIDKAVSDAAKWKHDKIEATAVNWNEALMVIGNCIKETFKDCDFGFFENLQHRAGSVSANFRRLHGEGPGSPPILMQIDGMLDTQQPYLIDHFDGTITPLFPWFLITNGGDFEKREYWVFDGADKNGNITYKNPLKAGIRSIGHGPDSDPDLGPYFSLAIEMISGGFKPMEAKVK